MTYKEAVDWMSCLRNVSEFDVSNMLGTWYKGIKSDFDKAVNLAIEALNRSEIPNNSDCISRQAALDIAFKYCPDDDGTCSEAGSDMRNMLDEIEALPPAHPERERGEWILVTDNNGQHYECSRCGSWIYHQEQEFCGSCGADMRGKNNGKTN